MKSIIQTFLITYLKTGLHKVADREIDTD